MNPIKPMSAKLAFLLLGLTIMISSAFFINDQILSYQVPITFLIVGIILLVEAGLKKFTDLSNLKRFGVVEKVTMVIGLILIISGLFALPFIPFQLAILVTAAGVIGMISGFMVIVQALV